MKSVKAALRRKITESEKGFSPEYIESSDRGIFDRLTAMCEYKFAEKIFVFYSMGKEPDTHAFIENALREGKEIFLPLINDGCMSARRIYGLDGLKPDDFGIPSPEEDAPEAAPEKLDFIVVPAMAFDRDGYRIGRGGGFYDRYLKDLSVFSVGIVRSRLLFDEVPRENHDVPVRCVLTEEETARLG